MIDTVVLSLPEHQFKISKPEKFNLPPDSLKSLSFKSNGILKAVHNPSKADKMKGYKPRLTLIKRPFSGGQPLELKIEFSAPKILFGNNFVEMRGKQDFAQLIQKLHAILYEMGIQTSQENLAGAKISAIHYSKNILLERTTPCFLLIQALEKLDLSKKLDLTQTDFRNGGQMAKYHASSYEIAFYDKVKDLEQAAKYGEKRGAEMDYECQTDFFKDIPYKPEVLRFEVRLKARKLKILLSTLDIKKSMTFEELFSATVARAVLQHYWQTVTDGLYIINIDVHDIEGLLNNLRACFPRKRPCKILEMMGFISACHALGINGARVSLSLSDAQFYRLKKDAKILETSSANPRFSVLNGIQKQLQEFIPLMKSDLTIEGLI